jgi:hypothetical protein
VNLLTENTWKAQKRAVIRALYDCIDAHEVRGESWINVNWLRDYVDDIAVHYPENEPESNK